MSALPRACTLYPDLLDGVYDCIDRLVLRAYDQFIQQPGGFRLWWRRWQGSDEQLDNAHLMRVAGRFARRVKAWAEQANVPVIFSGAGQRKDIISQGHRPRTRRSRAFFWWWSDVHPHAYGRCNTRPTDGSVASSAKRRGSIIMRFTSGTRSGATSSSASARTRRSTL